MSNHYRLLETDPNYRATLEQLEKTFRSRRSRSFDSATRVGITRIPVVVHVVFNSPNENISDAQINSQIATLNQDYRARNPDIARVPAVWSPLAADARIEFALATVDPAGRPTSGILRAATTRTSFTDDDAVKAVATGGSDAWPAANYLNLWVCNLAGTLLGYAQFPGGPANTDGVVITHRAFGTMGTAAPPFDLGRTATHEIGHWLNLRHIFGDDGIACTGSDFVNDTPNQGGPNYNKPTFPTVSCSNGPNGDMFMNYMDYVDDDTMFMFTSEQVVRMHATLDTVRSTIGTRVDFPHNYIKPYIFERAIDVNHDDARTTFSVMPNGDIALLFINPNKGAELRILAAPNYVKPYAFEREIDVNHDDARTTFSVMPNGDIALLFINPNKGAELRILAAPNYVKPYAFEREIDVNHDDARTTFSVMPNGDIALLFINPNKGAELRILAAPNYVKPYAFERAIDVNHDDARTTFSVMPNGDIALLFINPNKGAELRILAAPNYEKPYVFEREIDVNHDDARTTFSVMPNGDLALLFINPNKGAELRILS